MPRLVTYRRGWPPGAFGGRAIGAQIVGRFVAHDLTICDCCMCWVLPGEPVLDAVTVEGYPVLVCTECGPRP
jgi:hypothetical protein